MAIRQNVRNVAIIAHVDHGKTTTTAAYFAHKLIFNHDKTAMVVANKERTGKEILGKIKEVLEDLPYFMKPGIINLSDKKAGTGPYTAEVYLCYDVESGKSITIPEESRYQSLFVCGGSGSGSGSGSAPPLSHVVE